MTTKATVWAMLLGPFLACVSQAANEFELIDLNRPNVHTPLGISDAGKILYRGGDGLMYWEPGQQPFLLSPPPGYQNFPIESVMNSNGVVVCMYQHAATSKLSLFLYDQGPLPVEVGKSLFLPNKRLLRLTNDLRLISLEANFSVYSTNLILDRSDEYVENTGLGELSSVTTSPRGQVGAVGTVGLNQYTGYLWESQEKGAIFGPAAVSFPWRINGLNDSGLGVVHTPTGQYLMDMQSKTGPKVKNPGESSECLGVAEDGTAIFKNGEVYSMRGSLVDLNEELPKMCPPWDLVRVNAMTRDGVLLAEALRFSGGEGMIKLIPIRVKGKVLLRDFFPGPYGETVTMEIIKDGVVLESKEVALGPGGSYSLATGHFGTFDLRCKGRTWLSKTVKNVTFDLGMPGTADFSLLNGDCNDDNYVGTDDYLILNSAFDTEVGQPLFDARADLNGDGYVGSDDYIILNKNFDKEGV